MADPTYTLKQFGVDAAMLYVGTTPIGPSVGGYTHDPGVIWRTVEADGFPTERAGMSRITGWDSHIRGRIKELTIAQIMRLHPGSESDGSSPNNAILPGIGSAGLAARQFVAENQLLTDVRLVYRKHDPNNTGSPDYGTTFGAIIYPVARVVSAPQSGEDNNEQVREVDLKAILAATQASTECPYFEVDDYDHTTFDIADYITLTP